jgi:hypothetical protein
MGRGYFSPDARSTARAEDQDYGGQAYETEGHSRILPLVSKIKNIAWRGIAVEATVFASANTGTI